MLPTFATGGDLSVGAGQEHAQEAPRFGLVVACDIEQRGVEDGAEVELNLAAVLNE